MKLKDVPVLESVASDFKQNHKILSVVKYQLVK